jgi:hypothetical protein
MEEARLCISSIRGESSPVCSPRRGGALELAGRLVVARAELARVQPTAQRSWPARLAAAGAEPAVRLATAGQRKCLGRHHRHRR